MAKTEDSLLHFIRVNAPLPYAAADFVIKNFAPKRSGAADFSDTLFILPTRRAAETFQDVLLSRVLSSAGGILSLKAFTQEEFMAKVLRPAKRANIFASHCAWKIALGMLKRDFAEEIFPSGRLSEEDAFELSRRIGGLKRELSHAGLDFSSAAELAARLPDASRWRAFGELEKLYKKSLSMMGAEDAADVFLSSLANPDFSKLKEGRLVLLFCPETSAAFERILDEYRKHGGKVDIAVCADASKAALFGKYGAPLPGTEFFSDDLPDKNIKTFPDISAQARYAAEEISNAGKYAADIWAASCDETDSLEALSDELKKRNIDTISFAGRPISKFGIFEFFSFVLEFISDNLRFSAFMRIARTDIFLRIATKKLSMEATDILSALDSFEKEHMPRTLESAIQIQGGEKNRKAEHVIKFAAELLLPLCTEPASTALKNLAHAVENAKSDVIDDEQSQAEEMFLDKFLTDLDALDSLSFKHGMDAKEALKIMLVDSFGNVGEHALKRGVVLQNWLEQFWSEAPRLVIADFNDGKVPQSKAQDPFLSEAAREIFGLGTSALRRSRDEYMFQALIHSREDINAGFSINVLCPAKDFDGERLMPSSILLSCQPERMAERIRRLFGVDYDEPMAPAFFSPWKFRVPKIPFGRVISATDFKKYIDCPFRFYLEKVLKMRPVESVQEDMDAAVFGSLFHGVMEDFAKSANRNSSDENEICALLFKYLDARARKTFGSDMSAPLKLQLAGLRSRLRACARIQAEHAARGWRILNAESCFENLDICGMKIICRIDRIDKAPDGTLLALDYKTKDSSEIISADNSARKAHLQETGDGQYKWKDLQLPLYRRALMDFYGESRVQTAYFLSPKSVLQTRIDIWDIAESEDNSAMNKASEIIGAIRDEKFTPTEGVKPPRFDVYDKFFGFAGSELAKYLEFTRP